MSKRVNNKKGNRVGGKRHRVAEKFNVGLGWYRVLEKVSHTKVRSA